MTPCAVGSCKGIAAWLFLGAAARPHLVCDGCRKSLIAQGFEAEAFEEIENRVSTMSDKPRIEPPKPLAGMDVEWPFDEKGRRKRVISSKPEVVRSGCCTWPNCGGARSTQFSGVNQYGWVFWCSRNGHYFASPPS